MESDEVAKQTRTACAKTVRENAAKIEAQLEKMDWGDPLNEMEIEKLAFATGALHRTADKIERGE